MRSFLTFNSTFQILLGVSWMREYRPDVLTAVLPGYPAGYQDGGGSLWLQRVTAES